LAYTFTQLRGAAPPPGPRARFEAHLSICDACTTYLAQVRETIRLAGRVTEESVPPDVRDQLLQAFRDWKGA
jgi:anti-sigma factor RsiW